MEQNLDRRIRRTKNLLKSGLFDLMEQKSINEITIKELTERVDINRGTFYLHYKDIFELLEDIELKLMEELKEVCQKIPSEQVTKDSPFPFLTDIFVFLGKHAKEATILLGPHGDPAFVVQVKEMLKARCINDWMSLYKNADPIYYEYFYSFIVEGCIGLFKTWLATGQQQTPKQMGRIALEMISGGIHLLS